MSALLLRGGIACGALHDSGAVQILVDRRVLKGSEENLPNL